MTSGIVNRPSVVGQVARPPRPVAGLEDLGPGHPLTVGVDHPAGDRPQPRRRGAGSRPAVRTAGAFAQPECASSIPGAMTKARY